MRTQAQIDEYKKFIEKVYSYNMPVFLIIGCDKNGKLITINTKDGEKTNE